MSDDPRGLAACKPPDQLRTLTSFPLTAVGEIDKKALATIVCPHGPPRITLDAGLATIIARGR